MDEYVSVITQLALGQIKEVREVVVVVVRFTTTTNAGQERDGVLRGWREGGSSTQILLR